MSWRCLYSIKNTKLLFHKSCLSAMHVFHLKKQHFLESHLVYHVRVYAVPTLFLQYYLYFISLQDTVSPLMSPSLCFIIFRHHLCNTLAEKRCFTVGPCKYQLCFISPICPLRQPQCAKNCFPLTQNYERKGRRFEIASAIWQF